MDANFGIVKGQFEGIFGLERWQFYGYFWGYERPFWTSLDFFDSINLVVFEAVERVGFMDIFGLFHGLERVLREGDLWIFWGKNRANSVWHQKFVKTLIFGYFNGIYVATNIGHFCSEKWPQKWPMDTFLQKFCKFCEIFCPKSGQFVQLAGLVATFFQKVRARKPAWLSHL